MNAHPYFDLRLHDDAELAALLDAPLIRRELVQAWPLSCVEKIHLADGRVYIYKAQRAPTVEPAFYAAMAAHAAQSAVAADATRLLVGAQTLWEEAPYACLLLEYVDAPPFAEVYRTYELRPSACSLITRFIGALPEDVPVYLDVGTPERWDAFVKETIDLLRLLHAEGACPQVEHQTIMRLAHKLEARVELADLCRESQLLHGDLKPDNVLMTDLTIRVIDWQRPLRGPRLLDVGTLLEGLGVDPIPHVGKDVMVMRRVLDIHWLAECALRWFPAGRKTYDAQIAALIREVLRA
ncbi:MAG: phosphotransferase [Caldilineaceae bacterium]|nr:phosphotransferase [Caldilineaceae bacterium]